MENTRTTLPGIGRRITPLTGEERGALHTVSHPGWWWGCSAGPGRAPWASVNDVTGGNGRKRFSAVGTLGVVGSLTLVSACLTILFLSMRSVMDVGGFCAEGGPYVIATPCPKGIPGLMLGGIWIGIISVFIYAWQARTNGAVSLVGLLWPALFLSLGWNFLEYGVAPPFEGGLAWGWLVPGVLFVLMGGVPLLWVIPMMLRSDSTPRNLVGAALEQGVVAARRVATERRPTDDAPPPQVPFIDELERLARLHRRGSLSDVEYEAAKRRLLEAE